MLRSMHIRNYALIEEVQTVFLDGLTVLTGETGAGKSMLVTALGLALGEELLLNRCGLVLIPR